jgi:hypothetical protein
MTRLFTLLTAVACFALGLAFFATVDVNEARREVDTRPPSDIGPSLHPVGRECIWDFRREPIGKTAYYVALGPWYYKEDWDGYQNPRRGAPVFYSVQISTLVCGSLGFSCPWSFERDFRVQDLPAGFLSKPVSEIASFDEASSIVTLRIGNERIACKLP